MKRIRFLVPVIPFLLPFMSVAQSIVGTPHNLSISGTGAIKANIESRICIFCHTPHNGTPARPMWNRDDPGLTYTLYNSSTLNALPGQPDGASIMCLSCHDGTIALGNIYSETADISFAPITTMPLGKTNLSTDLRDDHPVSLLYDAALAASDGQLLQPALITPPVALPGNKVQCTSCHDPHFNLYNDFLLASTQFSALCLSCHDKAYWPLSSHGSSASVWNGSLPDPWPNSTYLTVAENACENCHRPHNSGGVPRLLKSQPEEDNCLDCHNGNVASSNIETQFAKPFAHDVYSYLDIHDPVEPYSVVTRHVE